LVPFSCARKKMNKVFKRKEVLPNAKAIKNTRRKIPRAFQSNPSGGAVTMIRPHAGALPAIPATPALVPGATLRHMTGVGKLPTVNPGPATAIVASRSLHGTILSRKMQHQRKALKKRALVCPYQMPFDSSTVTIF
jgi:hypothetical protein